MVHKNVMEQLFFGECCIQGMTLSVDSEYKHSSHMISLISFFNHTINLIESNEKRLKKLQEYELIYNFQNNKYIYILNNKIINNKYILN